MATRQQTQAAKRNVKKAQKAAAGHKTIAHLPADTRSALGKQGAAIAQRKGPGGASAKTRAELYEIARKRELPGLEVLTMLAAGRSNQAIAGQLVVTLDTVKKHVSHLLGKLGAASRTEAVARARQLGVIP
jgi:ATP/maltotriose-dependent transcriptional regulator MalT